MQGHDYIEASQHKREHSASQPMIKIQIMTERRIRVKIGFISSFKFSLLERNGRKHKDLIFIIFEPFF